MVSIREVEEGGASNDMTFAEGFEETSIRNKFIRKVYIILFLQLTVTTAIVGAFIFVDELKSYVLANRWVVYLASGIFFTMYILIVCPCCSSIRRSYPANIIILAILTLSMAFMTAVTASMYAPYSVFAALAGTMLITLGLSIFAIQTRFDLTSCAGVICMLSIFFMAFSMIVSMIFIFAGYSRKLDIVYAALGVLMMMIYLVYYTQMIVGGKNRKYEMSPEEYVFAALMLYMTIVELFLFLLRLFGDRE